MPKSPTEKADKILGLCLDAVESSVTKIVNAANKESRDFTADEIMQLLRTTRVMSDIKKGDKPKGLPGDATFEQLLEEARRYPELLDALRGSDADEGTTGEGADDAE